MGNDLVQRLRQLAECPYTASGSLLGKPFSVGIGPTVKEAADEIDRLQRERDEAEKLAESLQNKWANRPLDHPSGEALIAENDRLRAENEVLREQNLAMNSAEVSLRAALEKYGRHLSDGTMGGMCEGEYGALGLGPCTCGLDAALAGTESKDGTT